jgi:hypothetical protein
VSYERAPRRPAPLPPLPHSAALTALKLTTLGSLPPPLRPLSADIGADRRLAADVRVRGVDLSTLGLDIPDIDGDTRAIQEHAGAVFDVSRPSSHSQQLQQQHPRSGAAARIPPRPALQVPAGCSDMSDEPKPQRPIPAAPIAGQRRGLLVRQQPRGAGGAAAGGGAGGPHALGPHPRRRRGPRLLHAQPDHQRLQVAAAGPGLRHGGAPRARCHHAMRQAWPGLEQLRGRPAGGDQCPPPPFPPPPPPGP